MSNLVSGALDPTSTLEQELGGIHMSLLTSNLVQCLAVIVVLISLIAWLLHHQDKGLSCGDPYCACTFSGMLMWGVFSLPAQPFSPFAGPHCRIGK